MARYKDKKLIDPEYYKILAMVESNNNPNAKASTSSATGLYQFTEGTWLGLTDQLGLDYTLEDRKDPIKSKEVVEAFTKQNKNYLTKKLGKEPNNTELYLSHFLGMGGSSKLLSKLSEDPNATIDTVATRAQIEANKKIFLNKDGSFKRTKDIYNWAAGKFNEKSFKEATETKTVNYPKEREVQIDNTATKKVNFSYSSESASTKQPEILSEDTKKEFNEVKFLDDVVKRVSDIFKQPEQEQQISPFSNLQEQPIEQPTQEQNPMMGYDLYRPEENEFLQNFLQQ